MSFEVRVTVITINDNRKAIIAKANKQQFFSYFGFTHWHIPIEKHPQQKSQ
jgi:hypothetical protein